MGRYVIWIAFVVTLQISTVLCRNPFQEYFYNKYHHKGHSTTVSISSSTSDTSSEEITASSVSDYASLEDVLHSSSGGTLLKDLLHSSTVDLGTTVEGNLTILQYGNTYDETDHTYAGLLVGLVLLVPFAIGMTLCCCCCAKYYRKEQKGMILSCNEPDITRPVPGRSLFNHAYLPSYTEETGQQNQTQFQTIPQVSYFSAVRSLYQHNPASLMESRYLSESPPPPYEAHSFGAPPQEAPPYGN